MIREGHTRDRFESERAQYACVRRSRCGWELWKGEVGHRFFSGMMRRSNRGSDMPTGERDILQYRGLEQGWELPLVPSLTFAVGSPVYHPKGSPGVRVPCWDAHPGRELVGLPQLLREQCGRTWRVSSVSTRCRSKRGESPR